MPLLLSLACTPADDVREPTPQDTAPAFAAPWEGLDPTREVTGEFDAKIGKDYPGVGWWHVHGPNQPWGTEGTFVQKHDVQGASQALYTITLMGRDEDLVMWSLQFDVASSAWASDTAVGVDGQDAIGVIRSHGDDGDTVWAYVIGGGLWIDEAGTGQGDEVRGQFQNLSISEVTP